MIGRAAQHDAVKPLPLRHRLIEAGEAAVEHNAQMRPLRLQPPHEGIVEGRNVPVLLRRQARQPGLARMHDEDRDARGGAGVHQREQALFRVLIVDADAALDRDRDLHRRAHRRHTLGHQLGLAHQAGAEAARLHPVRRAADIQIDLVIAEAFADPRRLGELPRLRTAELQRDGVLDGVKAKEILSVAVQHRRGRHHLRIEQGALRQ